MYNTHKNNAVIKLTSFRSVGMRDIKTLLTASISRIKTLRDDEGRKNTMQTLPGNKGFTLIELLVVVLIIAILAAIALPQYQLAVARAHMNQLVVRFNALEKATQLYFLTYGAFPTDIRNLELDLSAPGAKYAQMSVYTSLKTAKGFEYPNGDQCGTWYDPRHNVVACTNKDLAISVYYPVGKGLTSPTRQCSAFSAAGEKICKDLSPTKKINKGYPTGFHQYSLD